jgi:diguanylate cyclase (GGDEF)-like protein
MRRSDRSSEIDRLRSRVDLEDRLRRALPATDSEAAAYDLVEHALVERFGTSTRILVPESGGLHLGPASLGDDDRPLIEASACLGYRRLLTVLTTTSATFDACAHLRSGPERVSGVCVPVAADSDDAYGVIQWSGPEHRALDPIEVGAIEMVAHLLAHQLDRLRTSIAESPRTDPLTGLLNPYSLRRALMGLVTELVPFSLASCGLDDFDDYRTAHGHHRGDEALRLVGHTLSRTVRPDDIVARTDLDRFTVVFPATSAIDAAHALERVREQLVLARSDSDLAAFTVSFGVADSDQGSSLESITDAAEGALDEARAAGANRVVVAGQQPGAQPDQ